MELMQVPTTQLAAAKSLAISHKRPSPTGKTKTKGARRAKTRPAHVLRKKKIMM